MLDALNVVKWRWILLGKLAMSCLPITDQTLLNNQSPFNNTFSENLPNLPLQMSASMYPEYPPELNEDQKSYLLTNLKDWSIAHGLAVRPAQAYVPAEQDPSGALATTAPVTLFPSLFPKVCFEQAKSVARAYNELYSAIASDENWLTGIVEE